MRISESWESLPRWVRSNMMGFSKRVALSFKGSKHILPADEAKQQTGDFVECSFADANLITSKVQNSSMVGLDGKLQPTHTPVLDIDIPCVYMPSSTEGHGHLYFQTVIPWDKYVRLLTVMGECGILEEGFVSASIAKEFTALRLPHIKKNGPLTPGPQRKENQDD